MNPIITIKNAKTNERAFVYREIYDSASKLLNGQSAAAQNDNIVCSAELFAHVVYMSKIINTSIRGRVELSIG
jgi:hypothetical protein